ncbi:NADPH:adrenodoxin oxidoreductase, mitochondrial [Smittium culicis]|uniref:NADPH:adrenodoxin oxidoreductase, mitochondrial n=1 Tax=Smittium culicis TaxID=133412 RepID=A0A1R1YGH7_9FUNG|nr:NADPH:adrenodoxin oxidoreductase, mitochondrial [Smittium culicis]
MNSLRAKILQRSNPLKALAKVSVFNSNSSTTSIRFHSTNSFSSVSNDPVYNVAIIGSGAAGFYTASKLLDKRSNINIDIYESLPVPYGLVRYGVAPDHPEVKICTNKFDEIGSDPRVRYYGNISIGKDLDLSVSKLRSLYDFVVLSNGTSAAKKLNIKGEDGEIDQVTNAQKNGIHSGRDFVNYYNGYPHSQSLFHSDFLSKGSSGKSIIFGVGNVSLDIARILLSDIDTLSKTDITSSYLEMLAKSTIKHVDIVGRRGALQSAFTTKELRELLKLPNVNFKFNYAELKKELDSDYARNVLPKSRQIKRKIDLLLQYENEKIQTSPVERLSNAISDSKSNKEKSWSLKFFMSPTSIENHPSQNCQIINLTRNNLIINQDLSTKLVAVPQSQVSEHVDVAFRSIGYESTQTDGFPFDQVKKIVPNISGRVFDPSTNDLVDGLYVSGWAKTGPTGVLASTMQDAYETAFAIDSDIQNHIDSVSSSGYIKSLSRSDIDKELQLSGVLGKSINYSQWIKIKEYEKKSGNNVGKVSEKVVDINKMIEIANS